MNTKERPPAGGFGAPIAPRPPPDPPRPPQGLCAGLVLSSAGALVIRFPPGSAVGAESTNRRFGVGLAVLGAVGWLMAAVRVRARIVPPEA